MTQPSPAKVSSLYELRGTIAQMTTYIRESLMLKQGACRFSLDAEVTIFLRTGHGEEWHSTTERPAWRDEYTTEMFTGPYDEVDDLIAQAWLFLMRQPSKEERDLHRAMRDISGVLERSEQYSDIAREIVQAKLRALREELATLALPKPRAQAGHGAAKKK